MKKLIYCVLIAGIWAEGSGNESAFANTQALTSRTELAPAIYGNDDRRDLFEISNKKHKLTALSTVALFRTDDLIKIDETKYKIKEQKLTSTGVCPSERFADQPVASFCSGTLVGKNLILTAGHCLSSQGECNITRFVFGYAIAAKDEFPEVVNAEEVYACKSIVHREHDTSGADFAILEVDRLVEHHSPIKLVNRGAKPIPKGEKVMLVGYPMGLPMKIDETGVVRDGNPNGFFVATFDSFRGNSGSGVFNFVTGELEGVFVRGEPDFKFVNGCNLYNHCTNTGCRGEDVTKASAIRPFLPI